jgi:hypothetical protein
MGATVTLEGRTELFQRALGRPHSQGGVTMVSLSLRRLVRYGRLRSPSRLSAALRPLTRRCAALTAILASQIIKPVRSEREKKMNSLGDEQNHGEQRLHKIADTAISSI